MRFPKWAPDDLVDYYSELDALEEEGFLVKKHKEILYRLITRTEMEKVWLWESKLPFRVPLSANGGIVGVLLRAYEEFNLAAKATPSERSKDYAEIKKLSAQLSVKLHKYEKEQFSGINKYGLIIPPEFDSVLFRCLKDDIQKKIVEIKSSNDREFPFWNDTLPPLSVLLNNLSKLAGEVDPNIIKLPRKINQSSALSTHLIKRINSIIFNVFNPIPPSIVATIVSIALDDPAVNVDSARKILAAKNTTKKLSKQLIKKKKDKN